MDVKGKVAVVTGSATGVGRATALQLAALGAEPMSGTPEQIGAFLRSEVAKWARVIKASGTRVE